MNWILLAVRSLSVILNNPALGGGSSVNNSEFAELLGMLGGLLETGGKTHKGMKQFAEQMKAMADSGHAPTRAEWEELRSRSDAAHEKLQKAKEKIESGTTEEE